MNWCLKVINDLIVQKENIHKLKFFIKKYSVGASDKTVAQLKPTREKKRSTGVTLHHEFGEYNSFSLPFFRFPRFECEVDETYWLVDSCLSLLMHWAMDLSFFLWLKSISEEKFQEQIISKENWVINLKNISSLNSLVHNFTII